ncbi:hypothetical protein ABGM91_01090 [Akkermansia muciniphila]|uniref:hypothetical protein n=1 Tax=Akkermansia muciniphila TaxID=239935 RepID=UPI00339F866B
MEKDLKIAACLSSYKRPSDLIRQIFTILHQSYSDVHLFVAIKGLTEYCVKTLIEPHFKQFINQKKLTLGIFPNKNQLSNFLDTIRTIKKTDYDLFLKIDDDDFYSHDYIKTINQFHQHLPKNFSSYCLAGEGTVLFSRQNFPCLMECSNASFGAAFSMSPAVIEQLFRCESDPSYMSTMIKRCTIERGCSEIGFGEDHLMFLIMQDIGCRNIYKFLKENNIRNHIICQKSNISVTRGQFLEQHFRSKNHSVCTDIDKNEYLLEIHHPYWDDTMRIFSGKAYLLGNGQEGDILHFTENAIQIKWASQEIQFFVKDDDGTYCFKCVDP